MRTIRATLNPRHAVSGATCRPGCLADDPALAPRQIAGAQLANDSRFQTDPTANRLVGGQFDCGSRDGWKSARLGSILGA